MFATFIALVVTVLLSIAVVKAVRQEGAGGQWIDPD